jgi:DNA-binding response OmpR family regulator
MAKILVVEDDRELSGVIQDWLIAEKHSVDVVHDGREATDRLKYYQYDVAILDWELPHVSGVDICKTYRASGGTMPILMLTGRRAVESRIEGLDAGADDYLGKPFELSELSARLRALLRRPAQYGGKTLTVRSIVLETDTYRVTVDGKEVTLLPKEFALLEFLMRHPNQVFSSEALIDRVWPSDSEASPDTVRTYVNRLRKKLDVEGQSSAIRTIHGIGYKLDAQ